MPNAGKPVRSLSETLQVKVQEVELGGWGSSPKRRPEGQWERKREG
jgi:hypothetical protein